MNWHEMCKEPTKRDTTLCHELQELQIFWLSGPQALTATNQNDVTVPVNSITYFVKLKVKEPFQLLGVKSTFLPQLNPGKCKY